MTQRESVLKNIVTEELRFVSKQEDMQEQELFNLVKDGRVVILKNNLHAINPLGIGEKLSVKINANIGTSPHTCSLDLEMKKLEVCEKFGADTVMDLSIGSDIDNTRRRILEKCKLPVGTVPFYQIYADLIQKGRNIEDLTIKDVLTIIERQAKDGIDFMTIHSGLTRKGMELARKRKLGIVSRGAALISEWMLKINKENLLLEYYDEILDILKAYDVTISLGDGLRPGCIDDATDAAQITELIQLGELTLKAWEKGVQVMVEGPGHVPFNQIEANILLQKRICHNAPFYVLGPLVTDIAPGYDHIVGAIGGTLAAVAGADFLCYLTPAEHLSLPDIEDVKEGIIASKIAAHAANIVKGIKKSKNQDSEMAKARKGLDWEKMFSLALDPEKARKYREKSKLDDQDVCSMCGDFCAVKKMKDL